MTEAEALELARQAGRTAKKTAKGDERVMLVEMQRMAQADPNLAEAFKQTGLLVVAQEQQLKH
ncbi:MULTISPECIES: hypothetical protein [Ralstonia]|uniref:Uncharacterized protein n=1 Tax=Ralstonia flatus TaxID=3058601 RepID=A0AAD2F8B4_9RALS|nr:hypothetical protein [Ralstonia sp. LMG 32965]MBN6211451.1 hypothetical protein [Ralstonia pickettii]CAJ0862316.1 hypothetical protein R77567_01637 [Ralstonia sp. LMG 32965]